MEPKNIEAFELELKINVEELEQRIAPGELVWPFQGGKGGSKRGKGGGGKRDKGGGGKRGR